MHRVPINADVPHRDEWPAGGILGRIVRGRLAGKFVFAEVVDGLSGDPSDEFYILHLPTQQLLVDEVSGALIMHDGVMDRWRDGSGGLIDELTSRVGIVWSTSDHRGTFDEGSLSRDPSTEDRAARRLLAATRMSRRRVNAAAPIRSELSRRTRATMVRIGGGLSLALLATIGGFVWMGVWNATHSTANCTVDTISLRWESHKYFMPDSRRPVSYNIDTIECGRLVLNSQGKIIDEVRSMAAELESGVTYTFALRGWNGSWPPTDRELRDARLVPVTP